MQEKHPGPLGWEMGSQGATEKKGKIKALECWVVGICQRVKEGAERIKPLSCDAGSEGLVLRNSRLGLIAGALCW